ncbi:MAG: hypothetical protein H6822_22670 [Planctomycetaceae bacterium]|nr:hypothetical protein [Planctomycetales bacterium]MCB9924999.1 hypothetical protein [Planctomycetaceae bacterium]
MARRTFAVQVSHRLSRMTLLGVAVRGMLLSCVSTSLWAQLPSTQLSSIFPPGGKFGTTFDVQVSGADQIDLSQLVFSHSGIKATQKTRKPNEFLAEEPAPGQFSVTVAGDVPPGVYEARVVGRYGVSNPRAFTVGIYDELVERGGNNSVESAFEIGVDKTVNGWVDANNIDHFKLALKDGQRVLLDCAAQRIDSRLDGTMIVYDPSGREIARNRDSIGTDPFIDLTATVSGDYIIAVYDFVYRGGNDSFYRLTVNSGPHVDFIFPPSGVAGSNDSYVVYGRNLPNGQRTDLAIDGVALEQVTVNIPLPADPTTARRLDIAELVVPQAAVLDAYVYQFNTANPATIHFARAPVVKEVEPNDDAKASQLVSVPCELVGQFYPRGDHDCFQFEAKKGEVYYLDLISHRLGLSTDPYLMVQRVTKNDQGEEVLANIATIDDPSDRNGRIGSNFDTSTDDPSYQLKIDQDAIYRITVRDQNGIAAVDPRNVYRLVVRPPQPDFRVVAIAEQIQAPVNANAVLAGTTSVRRGGTTLFDVRIERREGFDGEVAVTAEGLPSGVTCRETYIGANQNSGVLVFQASEDAAAWSGGIRVVGKATIDGTELARYARGGVVVWETGNRTQQPVNYRASRDIQFAVIDQDPDKALIEAGEDKIWETSLGGKLEIPIKVTRRDDFKSDLSLVPIEAANEFKPANIAVKAAEGEAKLALDIKNKATKPGIYTFYLRADAKIKHSRDPNAVARAESDQKAIEAALKDVTESLKVANDNKAMTVKAANDAAAATKQATDAKNAADAAAKQAADVVNQAVAKLTAATEAAAKSAGDEALAKAVVEAEKAKADAEAASAEATAKQRAAVQTLTEAQAAMQAADAAKAAAEKVAVETDAKLKRAQAAKTAVDKQVADAKKANAPADKNVAFLSTPIRLRIVETPLKLTANAPAEPLKQGDKLELPVSIGRMYGFAEPTDVTLELPKGVAGVTISKLTIAKDQQNGKFEVTANKDATPGEHAVTVRAKAKFNGIDVEASQQLVLKIVPVESVQ